MKFTLMWVIVLFFSETSIFENITLIKVLYKQFYKKTKTNLGALRDIKCAQGFPDNLTRFVSSLCTVDSDSVPP